jgi:hypothetical protein
LIVDVVLRLIFQPCSLPDVKLAAQENCVQRYKGVGMSVQKALEVAHFISAGGMSFARGLNDTPKIVALLLVIEGDFNAPNRRNFGRGNLLAVKRSLVFNEEAECLNPIRRNYLVAAFAKRLRQCLFYCQPSIRSTSSRKGKRRAGHPLPNDRTQNLTSRDSPPPCSRTKSWTAPVNSAIPCRVRKA